MSPAPSGKQLAKNYRDALAKVGGNTDGPPVLYVDHGDQGLPGDPQDTDSYDAHTWVICEICKIDLNRLTDLDGVDTWLHSRSWREYDHDPVPIAVDKDFVKVSTCDFCGVDAEMHWVYTGDRLRMGAGNTVHDYGRHWSACEHCGKLINASNFAGLRQRTLRVSPAMHGLTHAEREEAAESWMTLWGKFFPTVTEQQYIGPQIEPAKLNPRMMPKLQQGLVKFWKNDKLYTMVNRPDRLTTLPIPGVHDGKDDEFVIRFDPGHTMSPQTWRNHVDHLVTGIWAASNDLYWISSDFTRLAVLAGKDFDTLVLSREELPAAHGFMVFEEPIGEIKRPGGIARIRAVTWTLVPGGGIWTCLYMQGEDGEPEIDVETMRTEFGWLMCPNIGSGIVFDEEYPRRDGPEYTIVATIMATWFLMSQPGVAEQRPAPVDKKLARSFQRSNGRPLPAVQLIDLRRQPSRSRPATDHVGRPLTERVYRKGHWKRQAYGPKRGMRKTIYVSAYIAGPEGAPLKERPRTVKVLR